MYPLSSARGGRIRSGMGGPMGPGAIPIPPLTGFVSSWGLNNLNPIGYDGMGSVHIEGTSTDGDLLFTQSTPFLLNLSDTVGAAGDPPYAISTFYDQNSNAHDLTQTGTNRPTLQVTTPVIVSGAGTAAANGTYTYRGQSGGKAYYNLVGQADDPTKLAIAYSGGVWSLCSDIVDPVHGGFFVYYQAVEDVAFPWLASSWFITTGDEPPPTVTADPTGSGQIEFSAADEQFLANEDMGTLGDKVTIYLVFSSGGLATAQGLCQLDYVNDFLTSATGNNRFAIYQTAAGVLTAAQVLGDDVLPVFNSKLKTLAAANTQYLLSVIFDRTQTGAACTVMRLNNSTSGISNGVTDQMSGSFQVNQPFALGNGMPLGTALYHNGTINAGIICAAAHSGAELDATAAYLNSIQPVPLF